MSRSAFSARRMLAAACFAAMAGALPAAEPAISTMLPHGASRGTEADITFHGARLADVQNVIFAPPGIEPVGSPSGIEVLGISNPTDGNFVCKIRVAPDAILGFRAAYVQTVSGLSAPKFFFVGTLKDLPEPEPNNDRTAAPKVELETTIGGTVENEDVDNYSFEAAEGQRLNFEVEGLRLGDSRYDPMIVLFGPDGIEVGSADDTALVGQDCALSYVVKAAGTHTIQVREASFGGGGDYRYRLHLGTFPRPLGVFPPGGRPGEAVAARWIGDSAMSATTVTMPVKMETQDLWPEADGKFAQSPVAVRVANLDNLLETEPNNDVGTGTTSTLAQALNGILEAPGDVDFYRVEMKKDQGMHVEVYGRRLRSPIDPVLTIHRADGAGLAGNDDGAGPDSVLDFTAPEDGAYFLKVADHLNRGGPGYFYRVEMIGAPQKVWTGTYRPGIATTHHIPVPIGNRTAVNFHVYRQNFGGAINIEAVNLPAGMKAEVPSFTEAQDDLPILFSSEEATTISASLADLVAKPASGEPAVSGGIAQDVVLVRIENDVIVMTHPQRGLGLAVTQKVPFKIEVDPPKVPIVQNGRMLLTVRATRDEGYKDAIALRLLWNPPGISSSTPAIAAEATTTTLEINAAGNAQAGDYKLAVMAIAPFDAGGRGSVEVSSALIPFSVTPQWINIAMEKSRTEQGQNTEFKGTMTLVREFQGEAELELVGLPPKVSTDLLKVTKDSKEIKYALTIPAEAPAGKFDPLIRAVVMDQGEPIVHFLGQAELKIDTPIPPPAGEPAPTPAPAADAAAAPPEKKGPQPGDRKRAAGIAPFTK